MLQRSDDEDMAERPPESGVFHADRVRMEAVRERNRAKRGARVVSTGNCEACRWSIQADWQPHGVRLMRCNLYEATYLPDHGCEDFEREPGSD